MNEDKLLVVVRADLRPGQQACQAMHAARQFAFEHAHIELSWFERSNTLALLAVPNEQELTRLLTIAGDRCIRSSAFREPDLGDRLTAICLEPTEAARRICRNLPLALQ